MAIPTHGGSLYTPTVTSILHAKDECSREGWELEVHMRTSDADIARARNVLLAKFLTTNCTDLFFVDSDISWLPGAFTHVMKCEPEFMAGVYRLRTDDAVFYPVMWPEQKRMKVDAVTGAALLEAAGVPGGFWRLRRSCVETMAESVKDRWFVDARLPDLPCPLLFDWERDEHLRRSEDFTFCRKWRELGGEIWVDPNLSLGHTGIKTFDGHLASEISKEVKAHGGPLQPQEVRLYAPARAALANHGALRIDPARPGHKRQRRGSLDSGV